MLYPLRNILINSTLAYVAAFLLTTLLHESGHFASYALFGANPTLYHNYVSTAEGDLLALPVRVVSALAGPLTSLLQGAILAFVVFRRKGNSAADLLLLWLSLLGLVNFFGYLMMTPLSTVGDTGKVAELLQIGHLYRVAVAAGGLVVLILAVMKIGRRFGDFIPVSDEKERGRYVYHIMFFPIMIGCVFNMIFALPVVAWLSLVYAGTSSFVIMTSFGPILNAPVSHTSPSELEAGISKLIALVAVAAIAVNRLLILGAG